MDADDVLVARFRDHGDDRPGFAGDAEEVAQEVFLPVHHSLGGFRGDAQFSSWLYRIAFNLAVNLKERVRYRAPHLSGRGLGRPEFA